MQEDRTQLAVLPLTDQIMPKTEIARKPKPLDRERKYDAEVMEAIREASAALQGSHPDVLAQFSTAIESACGGDIEIEKLEDLFRSAAKALVTTDRGAAQTLFKMAETLAEIASYWALPRDLP